MLYISKKILSIIGASKKIRYDFDKMLKLIFLLLDILYNNTTIIGNISHTGITNLIILYPNNKLHKINGIDAKHDHLNFSISNLFLENLYILKVSSILTL